MTSLRNSVRTPTALNCSIPCIVSPLIYLYYFTAVPSVHADFASIVVLHSNYFWIKSHPPDQPRENIRTDRVRHTMLLRFFFLWLFLSFFPLLNPCFGLAWSVLLLTMLQVITLVKRLAVVRRSTAF